MTKQNLEMVEANDVTLKVTITNEGEVFNLTGATAEFYAKQDVYDLDSEAVMTYTTTNGRAVVVSAMDGRLDVLVRGIDANPGLYSYHLDIITGGKRLTAGYGSLRVVNV